MDSLTNYFVSSKHYQIRLIIVNLQQLQMFFTMSIPSPARQFQIHRLPVAVHLLIRPNSQLSASSKPLSFGRTSKLSLILLNAQSRLSMIGILRRFVQNQSYNIILINETWSTEYTPTNLMFLTGYNYFLMHRTNRRLLPGLRQASIHSFHHSPSSVRHFGTLFISITL